MQICWASEGHGASVGNELKILPALMQTSMKMPLFIYGLLRACSMLDEADGRADGSFFGVN